jgi:hypothetical protein
MRNTVIIARSGLAGKRIWKSEGRSRPRPPSLFYSLCADLQNYERTLGRAKRIGGSFESDNSGRGALSVIPLISHKCSVERIAAATEEETEPYQSGTAINRKQPQGAGGVKPFTINAWDGNRTRTLARSEGF